MPAEFNPEKIMNTQSTQSPAAFASQEDGEDELIWELLSLYVDGEASKEEAAQVEQMLRHDAEYARAYAFMQQAGSTIRTIVEIEPPTHLRDAILAKTSHRPTFSQRLGLAVLAFRTQFALPVGRLAFAGGSLALVIGICVGRMSSVNVPANIPNVASISTPANPVTSDAHTTPSAPPVPKVGDIVWHAPSLAKVDIKPAPDAKIDKNDTRLHAVAPKKSVGSTTGSLAANTAQSLGPVGLKPVVNILPMPAPQQHHLPGTKNQQIVQNTRNVNPMMDVAVYHLQNNSEAAKPAADDGDDLNDEHLVTTRDDMPDTQIANTDQTSTSAAGHKIEGKLLLSKLPPSARHLLSPAEAVRKANAMSAGNYNAASSDDTQEHTAEVHILTSKF